MKCHIFGTLYYTKIEKVNDLILRMERIVNTLKLNEVARAFHQFEPYGATGVIVLSESHFSVHTYPEYEKVYLDLFCCSNDFDPEKASNVIMDIFCTDVFEWKYIER